MFSLRVICTLINILTLLLLYGHALYKKQLSVNDFTVSRALCVTRHTPQLRWTILVLIILSLVLQLVYGLFVYKNTWYLILLYILLILFLMYLSAVTIETNCNSDTKNIHFKYAFLLLIALWIQCCMVAYSPFTISMGITLIALIVYLSVNTKNTTIVSIFELLFFIQYIAC